jgi:ATP-dependent helicase/nuclease subunit A
MSRRTPSDQPARDRFANEVDSNLCVSASAGAGKTTSIVDRVKKLIETPTDPSTGRHPVERLAVVTYGEKAAEELRVRCRTRVLSDAVSPPEKNRQLNLLRQATFGTIHSFCLKLLRDFGGARGIPTEISLLAEKDEVFFEAFKQDVDLNTMGWPEDIASEVLRYRTFEELFNLARRIRPEQVEPLLQKKLTYMDPPDVEPLLLYEVKSKRSAGTVGGHQAALHRWRDGVASASPFLHLPEIRTGEKEFKEMAVERVDPYLQWLTEAMVMLAAYLARDYRDYRITHGRLTYDDMVGEAWRLVQEPETLDAMRKHGWMIILDEAQDTDATMFRILTELTRPLGAGVGTWPHQVDAPGPESGRFSFVGDDQQCIYSNRADIGQYLEYVEAYGEGRGGEQIEFKVTMRCPERVVEAVNQTFPGRLQQSRASFRLMEAMPRERSWPERVSRVPLEVHPDGDGVNERFAAEARAMGAWLRETGLSGLGVEKWSDVAILCPRVRWLSDAGEALTREGIPVAHQSSGTTAAEQPSSSWPVALFHVLCHPFDRFELVGVLRDLFAFPDARIEQLHRQDPSGLSLFSRPQADPEMESVFNWLQQSYRLLADLDLPGRAVPMGRLVRRLCDEIDLAGRIEAAGDARESLSRFIASAAEASANGASLRDWLTERRLQLSEKSPPLSAMGGLDLISCHKAKGLEWKVVIVLGIWRKIVDAHPAYPVIRQREGEIRILADGQSETGEEREQSQRWRKEDYQRLIYVAMTRSQGSLIISDPDLEADDASMAGFIGWPEIRTHFPEAEGAPSETTARQPAQENREEVGAVVDLNDLSAWSHRLPQRLTPHSLAHGQEDFQSPSELREPMEPGLGGIEYGLLWHEWIEHLPWSHGPETCREHLQTKIRELQNTPASSAHSRFAEEIKFFTDSSAFGEILSAGVQHFPELSFSWAKEQNRWMEGVIDLLVKTPEEWWIIDWKTNRSASGQGEEEFHQHLADLYREQLHAYRKFIESRQPGNPVRASLYSTVTGGVIDV